ncbi:MAG TPA: hypothetical protein DHV28_02360 [Ignavibacteriales bacterium]|nr:hypothetical protein [Ignavibacteriales bacterium]
MNTKNNKPLVIAFVVVIVLFLLFGSGAMTGGMMDGGMHNSLNENGWMSNRSWMWFPTLITLSIGIVIGWLIFKKK